MAQGPALASRARERVFRRCGALITSTLSDMLALWRGKGRSAPGPGNEPPLCDLRGCGLDQLTWSQKNPDFVSTFSLKPPRHAHEGRPTSSKWYLKLVCNRFVPALPQLRTAYKKRRFYTSHPHKIRWLPRNPPPPCSLAFQKPHFSQTEFTQLL